MTINYLGHTCFRLQNSVFSLLLEPYDSAIFGTPLPRMQNDIVLFTTENKSKEFSDKTMVINTPGEYEVKDCFIYGLPAANGGQGSQTIYFIEIEGISLAYTGLLTKPDLSQSQLERLEGVDILILPVGGGESLNEKQAAALVNQLEPRIVIPMYYDLPKLKLKLESVEKFKKELGVKSEEMDKLKIVKKDLPQEETKLIILKPNVQ